MLKKTENKIKKRPGLTHFLKQKIISVSCQVFIAVTTTKSMQSVTNIFIVNLAMADMLVMLFCAPPSVIWDVTNTWIFGSLMCRIVIYIQVKLFKQLLCYSTIPVDNMQCDQMLE